MPKIISRTALLYPYHRHPDASNRLNSLQFVDPDPSKNRQFGRLRNSFSGFQIFSNLFGLAVSNLRKKFMYTRTGLVKTYAQLFYNSSLTQPDESRATPLQGAGRREDCNLRFEPGVCQRPFLESGCCTPITGTPAQAIV